MSTLCSGELTRPVCILDCLPDSTLPITNKQIPEIHVDIWRRNHYQNLLIISSCNDIKNLNKKGLKKANQGPLVNKMLKLQRY